eukprot:jgi/Psemu1/38062/gm1.38062_g
MTNSAVAGASAKKEETHARTHTHTNTHTKTTTTAVDSAVAAIHDKTRERDEKEESSTSTGSDGGKGNSSGSGSGSGGYNADCSSSDTSSNNEAAATRIPQKQMAKLAIIENNCGTEKTRQGSAAEKDPGTNSAISNHPNNNNNNNASNGGTGQSTQSRSKSKSKSKSKSIIGQSSGKRGTRHNNNNNNNNNASSSHNSKNKAFSNDSRSNESNSVVSSVIEGSTCLPQWNGVKIVHPMDPRIDLTTVGFSFCGSSQTNLLVSNHNNNNSNNNNNNNNSIHDSGSMKKTEVIQKGQPNKYDTSNGNSNNNNNNNNNITSVEQYAKLLESTPEEPVESSTESKEQEEHVVSHQHAEINTAVGDLLNTAKNELAAAYATAAAAAAPQDNNDETDKDSSSMVVLARPKRKHSTKQEGTDSNSGRSASSSEEEARGQQQQQQQQQQHQHRQHHLQQQAPNEEDIADDENSGGEHQQAIEEEEDAPQQPQEQQNLLQVGGGPQRYGISTMVSEYSSSNRNTSGSGSGGNTGSGTGSGSNQGGSSGSGPSSGSGNDQGGISSNGNGSSGSGNDKGSSEEMMDNNGETNSTENSNGNSDEKSSKNTKIKPDDNNANVTRFSPNPSEPSTQRSQDQNAAREKKLQDKKRKRMNMRRVYEDQMELDMGSSESSFEQGVLRPGKPVTLDNAISFTKTAKLVIKASPPLTIIHTNAAYTRLSGIDSHEAVGNSVTSLLSLPHHHHHHQQQQQQQLPQLNFQKDDATPPDDRMDGIDEAETDDKNHAAAEAAGRARAAASRDDGSMESLEKLIVVSGHNKLNEINIHCNPHKIIGRNVKTFKSMVVPSKRNQDEGSNGNSSITSSYGHYYTFVACNMSISPVVSSPEIYNDPAMTNKDKKGEHHHNKVKRNEKDHDSHQQQKAKRRKHHHTMNDIIHNRKRQVVSHYVIHLEPLERDMAQTDAVGGSQSSLSTDGEDRVVRQQRVVPSTVNTGKQTTEGEKEGESSQKEVSAIA